MKYAGIASVRAKICIMVLVTLFFSLFNIEANASTLGASGSTKLIFSLDQGFPWGITENLDLNGLDRALDVLNKIGEKHEVYALFSPLTANQDNLRRVLLHTAQHHIHFFLDVYTSDGMSIGGVLTPVNPNADPSHGLTTSVAWLRSLKEDKQIGPYFSGIRLFELLAEDYTVKQCVSREGTANSVNWCDNFKKNIKGVDVLDFNIAKSLLDFAKNEGMQVFWSDWKWDAQTAEQQGLVDRLLRSGDYRNTVVLAYANNLPDEAARTNDSNWQIWRKKYSSQVGKTIAGLGISDQSWVCDSQYACPENVVREWADRAIQSRAAILQFEPVTYFFEFPLGKDASYPSSAHWQQVAGRPSEQLAMLAKSLGVDLTTSPPGPLSLIQENRVICESESVPVHSVPAGKSVVVNAVFRNAGVNGWDAGKLTVAPQPTDGWKLDHLSTSSGHIESRQNFSISLVATAPEKPGKSLLDIRLRTAEGKPLTGGYCSILMNVTSKSQG